MPPHVSRFWAETEQYHDLAEHYERNIEMTHPSYVTSRGRLCGWWESWCDWAATSVEYYEYRGESV